MASLRSKTLSAYAKLMRAQRDTFHEDVKMRLAAAQRIQTAFRANKDVADEKKIAELVKNAEDTANFLRKHIAQGVLTDEGRYGNSQITSRLCCEHTYANRVRSCQAHQGPREKKEAQF